MNISLSKPNTSSDLAVNVYKELRNYGLNVKNSYKGNDRHGINKGLALCEGMLKGSALDFWIRTLYAENVKLYLVTYFDNDERNEFIAINYKECISLAERIMKCFRWKPDTVNKHNEENISYKSGDKLLVEVKRLVNEKPKTRLNDKTEKVISKLSKGTTFDMMESAIGKAQRMPIVTALEGAKRCELTRVDYYEFTLKKLTDLVLAVAKDLSHDGKFKRSNVLEVLGKALGFESWNHLKAHDKSISHTRCLPVLKSVNSEFVSFKDLKDALCELNNINGKLHFTLVNTASFRFYKDVDQSIRYFYKQIEFTPQIE